MKKTGRGFLAPLVAGLLIGAAATYALTGNLSRTSTSTTTVTISQTITPTMMETASSSVTSPCIIVAEGFLVMHVLDSSSGQPIGSLPIQVEALYPACLSNPPVRQNLGTVDTNASGVLSLGGPYDWYYLTINYSLRSYSVNASINAGRLTCVTLRIPSDVLEITHPSGPC